MVVGSAAPELIKAEQEIIKIVVMKNITGGYLTTPLMNSPLITPKVINNTPKMTVKFTFNDSLNRKPVDSKSPKGKQKTIKESNGKDILSINNLE